MKFPPYILPIALVAATAASLGHFPYPLEDPIPAAWGFLDEATAITLTVFVASLVPGVLAVFLRILHPQSKAVAQFVKLYWSGALLLIGTLLLDPFESFSWYMD